MTEGGASFLIIFEMKKELSGSFYGPVKISPDMEKYVRFYNSEWFAGESIDQIDLVTGCNLSSGKVNKLCILGLFLSYNPLSGFLTLTKEDVEASKNAFPSLTNDMIGSLIARVE